MTLGLWVQKEYTIEFYWLPGNIDLSVPLGKSILLLKDTATGALDVQIHREGGHSAHIFYRATVGKVRVNIMSHRPLIWLPDVVHAFDKQGFLALYDEARSGRKSALTQAQLEQVVS